MSVILRDGAASAQLAGVDGGNYKGLRTINVPMNSLAWQSVGAESGALTGVGAANSAIFSLRNIGSNILVVRRVGVYFITTTAFTAAQRIAFGLLVQRSFTVSDSGGTTITLTGNNAKLKADLAVLTNVDCRIATTGSLTGGTKTADANTIAVVSGWSGAAGQGIVPAGNNLFNTSAEDHPIILKTNEGINIMNLVAMGAAGVGTFGINLDIAEIATTAL